MQYAMAFSGIEGGNMKRVPAILAIIIGILDAALAVGIVLLLVQPGGSGGESAAVISESFEDNSESYGDAAPSSAYTRIIRAETGNTSASSNEPIPTLTPTPSPSASETVEGMPDSDFIFPYSSTRQITEPEMNQKLTDKSTSQRAINEIYARHGYLFHEDKNPVDYAYFNSKSWYQALPKIDSQETVRSQFNDTEIANVDALIAYQNARNWG